MNGTTRRGNREGTYYQRPEGGWVFRVEVNGQRVSGSGRTKTEAKRRAMERAKVVGEVRAHDTVGSLFDSWAARGHEAAKLAPTTFDQYRSLLATHIVGPDDAPILGAIRLDRLTKRQVADRFEAMADCAPSTRRSTYAALVKLLDHAVSTGQLGRNVAREVPRPTLLAPKERAVDPAGARRMLGAMQGHRWAVAGILGFACGLRRGEILGLRWADIDFDAAVLTVSGNVTRSSAGLTRGKPKTRRGLRKVPLPPIALEALRVHRKAQAAQRLAALVWQDSDLVITNEIGGAVEPRSLSRAWAEWAKAAGLQDTGTHLGRHFAATSLLASGRASVADVAAMLGHDPAVLLNTYASAVAAGQRAAMDVLGEVLTGTEIVPVFVPVASQNGPTPADSGGQSEHESGPKAASGGPR